MAQIVPALLVRVYICIAFNWDVRKLAYLQQVLNNIDLYETSVHTEVLTNEPQYLAAPKLLPSWRLRHSVAVVGPSTSASYEKDKHVHRLVWEHRQYMQRAFNTGNYSSYLYIEDDTHIPWPALVAWAFDTEVLAPLGFMRGFYRTEVNPTTGDVAMLDCVEPLNMTAWNRTVHVPLSPFVCDTTTYGDWVLAQPNATTRQQAATCLAHAHYIELPCPYMGMWISTHKQLQRFTQFDFWKKEIAITTDSVNGTSLRTYGYPERTNVFNILVDVPPGHDFASVVPYDPRTKELASNAAIAHLRNAYYKKSLDWSVIPVQDYMYGVN